MIRFVCSVTVLLLLAGCASRPISNSGYSRHGYGGGNPLYRGELSEFDVLGVRAGASVTEEAIRAALDERPERITLRRGDPVLLIQSGALMPDEEMIAHLERDLSVTVFTGIPEREDGTQLASSLRLDGRAAYRTIWWPACWNRHAELATKTVSGADHGYGCRTNRHADQAEGGAMTCVAREMFTPDLRGQEHERAVNRRNSDQAQSPLKSQAREGGGRDRVALYPVDRLTAD